VLTSKVLLCGKTCVSLGRKLSKDQNAEVCPEMLWHYQIMPSTGKAMRLLRSIRFQGYLKLAVCWIDFFFH